MLQAGEAAPAADASEASALPPLKPGVAVEESVYDAVELDFLSDDCEFCRMMKVHSTGQARGGVERLEVEQGGEWRITRGCSGRDVLVR